MILCIAAFVLDETNNEPQPGPTTVARVHEITTKSDDQLSSDDLDVGPLKAPKTASFIGKTLTLAGTQALSHGVPGSIVDAQRTDGDRLREAWSAASTARTAAGRAASGSRTSRFNGSPTRRSTSAHWTHGRHRATGVAPGWRHTKRNVLADPRSLVRLGDSRGGLASPPQLGPHEAHTSSTAPPRRWPPKLCRPASWPARWR